MLPLTSSTPVPKKIAKAKKEGHVHATEENDNLLLLDRKQISSTQTQLRFTQATPSPSRAQSKAKPIVNPNDSDTEDEDEEEEILLNKPKGDLHPHANRSNFPLPTPARSASPQIDLGRAPGRIIGTTYPLADFKKNIGRGDVVSKAVEDLGWVVTEIIMRPFSSRRSNELIECMKALRHTCLTVSFWMAWFMNALIKLIRKTRSMRGTCQ